MEMPTTNPKLRGLIAYGGDANCTLKAGPDYCDPKYGVYQYIPSLAANVTFMVLYIIALIIHVLMGLKWKTWFFSSTIFWGIVAEVIGYGGRIMLHQNPFSFSGFLMQIICLTLGPTWFTAAIYLTLYKM